ncbi:MULTISPECIES: lipopolysaccharide biosynthesis protein [unclassified Variovorax]|uniref:lipopolysaccharide biosynthesis protein n=1 Tax=unclassified Variovorax TaxID=663243 RepID=UPI0034E8A7A1
MNLQRVAAVLNTLILRGAGAGVAVLFTVLVSRYLETRDAARFFLLFNISVIAAVCYRWGLDEVIIRRIASASTSDVSTLRAQLIAISHRRVLTWTGFSLIWTLALLQPKISSLLYGFTFTEALGLTVASALIALSACAARAYQGEGRTNLATFLLNIVVPLFSLFGLLLLMAGGWRLNAEKLFFLYTAIAFFVYLSVIATYRSPRSVLARCASGPEAADRRADSRAANKLGGVVLAQQILGWSALLVVPTVYGAELYKGFVVAQKISTLISLVMLAINFTFSSRFAALYAERKFNELRRIIKISFFAIFGASILAFIAIMLFREKIFAFARVEANMDATLVVLLFSQVLFSVASLFSVVLSMCRDESFLLISQGAINFIGVLVFFCLSYFFSLEVACVAFVFGYLVLSWILGMRVRNITVA